MNSLVSKLNLVLPIAHQSCSVSVMSSPAQTIPSLLSFQTFHIPISTHSADILCRTLKPSHKLQNSLCSKTPSFPMVPMEEQPCFHRSAPISAQCHPTHSTVSSEHGLPVGSGTLPPCSPPVLLVAHPDSSLWDPPQPHS